MKHINNKILEAVNRGIQLALDDYQDIEDNNSISHTNDIIDSENVIKHRIDLMKEVVDLGLPSKTLWCKYNLDVNPNQLSNAEDWYGKYYAWGELKGNKTNENGKLYFNFDNYKFGKDYNKLTKYCNNPKYGLKRFVDNLTQLLPEDDIAYQSKKLHNYKFHIPTKEQYEELINYTENYWVYNYDPNKLVHNPEDDGGIQGLNGRVFEGKNKNQMFIPAAGYYNGSDLNFAGERCWAWSSSLYLNRPYLNHPYCAYCLHFDDDDDVYPQSNTIRCHGHSVRPVVNL